MAKRLGFPSLQEVETFMDLADEPVTYKDLAERMGGLKAELAMEQRDNHALREELLDLREERDLLKARDAQNQRCPSSCRRV